MGDEDTYGMDVNDVQRRILNIVGKVTKNRNRPCLQNIHTLLTRGAECDIEEKDLKPLINAMVDGGMLKNVGTEEKESYRVVEGGEEESPSVEAQHIVLDQTLDDSIFVVAEKKVTTNQSEQFINPNSYEDLIQRIKLEVVKYVDEKLKAYNNPRIPSAVEEIPVEIAPPNNNESNNGDCLAINELNKKLEIMRAELRSKDKIIELLKKHNDYNSSNSNSVKSDVNNKKQNTRQKRVVRKSEHGELSISLNNKTDVSHIEEDSFEKVSKKVKKNTRTVTVIGDSTLKDCKPHKMKHKLGRNEKLYIKAFNGANIEDMADYARPTVRRAPDLIVLHAGTNDLRGEKSAKNIADDIIKLGLEIKSDLNDVMISSIIFRADSLNEKGMEVNKYLKAECANHGLFFIDNSNIAKHHLNGSGLHLNFKGTVTLANNFLNHIKI